MYLNFNVCVGLAWKGPWFGKVIILVVDWLLLHLYLLLRPRSIPLDSLHLTRCRVDRASTSKVVVALHACTIWTDWIHLGVVFAYVDVFKQILFLPLIVANIKSVSAIFLLKNARTSISGRGIIVRTWLQVILKWKAGLQISSVDTFAKTVIVINCFLTDFLPRMILPLLSKANANWETFLRFFFVFFNLARSDDYILSIKTILLIWLRRHIWMHTLFGIVKVICSKSQPS